MVCEVTLLERSEIPEDSVNYQVITNVNTRLYHHAGQTVKFLIGDTIIYKVTNQECLGVYDLSETEPTQKLHKVSSIPSRGRVIYDEKMFAITNYLSKTLVYASDKEGNKELWEMEGFENSSLKLDDVSKDETGYLFLVSELVGQAKNTYVMNQKGKRVAYCGYYSTAYKYSIVKGYMCLASFWKVSLQSFDGKEKFYIPTEVTICGKKVILFSDTLIDGPIKYINYSCEDYIYLVPLTDDLLQSEKYQPIEVEPDFIFPKVEGLTIERVDKHYIYYSCTDDNLIHSLIRYRPSKMTKSARKVVR